MINEGLVIFRDSKRLKKIADKIEQRSQYSSAEIGIVVSKLRGIAGLFEVLENKFKIASPDEATSIKMQYAILRKKYSDFINLINRESFVKALKTAGILGIVGASVFLGYKNIDLYEKKMATDAIPSPKIEVRVQGLVNGAIAGGSVLTTVGFVELFKKLFSNKGDELYLKTKEALSTLEKVEKMKKISDLEGGTNEQL